jgi:nitrogen regulatory protein PII
MKTVKKLELILETVYLHKIISLLKAHDINGYSIINELSGMGSHGYHDAQDITNVMTNSYIICILDNDDYEELVEKIRSLLNDFGGICWISCVDRIVVRKRV